MGVELPSTFTEPEILGVQSQRWESGPRVVSTAIETHCTTEIVQQSKKMPRRQITLLTWIFALSMDFGSTICSQLDFHGQTAGVGEMQQL